MSDSEKAAKYRAYKQERLDYWTGFARSFDRWRRPRAYYQRRLAEIYGFLVPPGKRVLRSAAAKGTCWRL